MDWMQHPAVQAMWIGFTGALMIDLLAFRKYTKWEDAATYSWSVASLRWVQGIVGGVAGWMGWTGVSQIIG